MQGGWWKAINNVCGSGYCLIPIGKRHGCLSKKCEGNFSNVMMFAFNSTVLVMCIRADKAMYYALRLKILGEGAKFTAPVRLNRFNRDTELEFYHGFKL